MIWGQAETLISTHGWTRAEFDAYRPQMRTCGASQAFAILYGARLELALQMRGTITGFTGSDYSRLGHLAEPYARTMLSDELDRPVQAADCILLHPNLRTLHATPDGFTVGPEGLEGVEAKWTNGRNRPGLDLLTEHGPHAAMGHYAFRAWVQACHSLAVTGLDKWWICWIVGGEAGMRALAGLEPVAGDFYSFPVRRDDEDVAGMIGVIEREIPAYWAQFVEGDALPAPNPDAAGDLRAIGKAYRIEEGLEIELPDLHDTCANYVAARTLASEQNKWKDVYKASILYAMGDATVAHVPNFSVKRGKRGQLLVKERG